MTKPLALTMGEPAGIGGEVALLAWLRREEKSVPPFFVIDDALRLERIAAGLGWHARLQPLAAPEQAADAFSQALPVLPLRLPQPATPGRPDPANAPAVIEAITIGAELARSGRAGALVTGPIQKETLYAAGFRHPGHTEFLAELAGGGAPVMMLACPELRVVLVTIHQPLREAVAALSIERIVGVGRIAAAGLARDFGIPRPRLAVAGLNPACGRARHHRPRGDRHHRPGRRRAARAGHRCLRPLPPPIRCFIPRRDGATTPRSACITTRR